MKQRIEEAKKMEMKVDRIGKMMDCLEKGLKFYDWVKQD